MELAANSSLEHAKQIRDAVEEEKWLEWVCEISSLSHIILHQSSAHRIAVLLIKPLTGDPYAIGAD